MADYIHFSCPTCRKTYDVEGGFAGDKFACACGQRLEVPTPVAVALPHQNKTVLGEVQGLPQSAMATPLLAAPAKEQDSLRCHNCNRMVPVASLVKRSVHLGTSAGIGGLSSSRGVESGYFAAGHWGTVNLCQSCASGHDESSDKNVVAVVIAAIILMMIVIGGGLVMLINR